MRHRADSLAAERGGQYRAGIITNGYLLTQKMVDMLERRKVKSAQVTIDGLGATHDATRRLANGGPTFGRITDNLRGRKIPFKVSIRHNVHAGNMEEMDELKAFVENLARESGNGLSYHPAAVVGSEVANAHKDQVRLLCSSDASKVGLREETAAADAALFFPNRLRTEARAGAYHEIEMRNEVRAKRRVASMSIRDLMAGDPAREDMLVLVDGLDREAGCATKERAHREGLLHRAFSVVLVCARALRRLGAHGVEPSAGRAARRRFRRCGGVVRSVA